MEKQIDISVAVAETPEDIAAVRGLFREYAESMRLELCFEGFDKEMESLPGPCAPPGSELLLCRVGGEPTGCGGDLPLCAGCGGDETALCAPGFSRDEDRPKSRMAGHGYGGRGRLCVDPPGNRSQPYGNRRRHVPQTRLRTGARAEGPTRESSATAARWPT